MPFFAPIRQDDYPATDELQCIAVYIPAGDEYKALLAGFLAFLTDTNSYEDPESAQADGIAAVFDTGYAQSNWDGCGIPPECEHMDSEITITPITLIVGIGNAFAAAFNGTVQRNNIAYAQNPAIQSQSAATSRYMAAGSWSYRITGVRRNSAGILKIDLIDSGASVFASLIHDMYVLGADQFNQYFTGTFTVPEDGEVTIDFLTNGKNASSSGFSTWVTILEMWRTT